MKFPKLAAAAALAFAAVPALAANPQVVTGATVYGPQGNVVGTIESVGGGIVTVDTGAHKAPLPENAFGQGDNGPTITVTKDQLDSMMADIEAKAAAQRDAALVVGAAVVSVDGQPMGTIESVDGDAIVLAGDEGKAQLKREHFAVTANGALTVLFTKQQLAQAIANAKQAGAAQSGA